jgi:putative transcriptional regulator
VTRRPADASDGEGPAGQDETAAIRLHLDELLAQRGMTLTELSARVGITIVNLSILKNGRARAIRFSTLARLCEALDCQPGELLSYQPRPASLAACGGGSSHADAGPAGHPAGGRGLAN